MAIILPIFVTLKIKKGEKKGLLFGLRRGIIILLLIFSDNRVELSILPFAQILLSTRTPVSSVREHAFKQTHGNVSYRKQSCPLTIHCCVAQEYC